MSFGEDKKKKKERKNLIIHRVSCKNLSYKENKFDLPGQFMGFKA
jgi:hypothetical protein